MNDSPADLGRSGPIGLFVDSVYDLVDPRFSEDSSPAAIAELVGEFSALDRSGITYLIVNDAFDSAVDRLDPIVTLSFVSQHVPELGLVAGSAIRALEPFHVAKRLQTLDNVTRGGAGWLINPLLSEEGSDLIDTRRPLGPVVDASYAREFAQVVTLLWDSWEEGSIVRDKDRGIYLDPQLVHHIHHQGPHLTVRGPSLTPRSPQGRPPVFALASDESTAEVAAATADIVLVPTGTQLSNLLERETDPAARPIRTAELIDPLVEAVGPGTVIDGRSGRYRSARSQILALPPAVRGGRHLRDLLGLSRAENTFTRAAEENAHV